MDNKVLIKSFPNGISLHLDENTPFEEVLREIEEKFADSAKFFRGNRLALSIEGRSLNDLQEEQIVKAITSKGELDIVCLIGKDKSKDDLYIRAIHQTVQKKQEECPIQFFKGTLSAGQAVESTRSVIILGNVEKGCKVTSDHDIIVIGALEGEAHAGANGETDRFIAALSMNPEKLKIADIKYKDSSKGIFKKKTKQPQIAVIKDSVIVTEDITKELLNNLSMNNC